MPTPSTQSLPWWSSQVRLEDLPGEDAREARRAPHRAAAKAKARIAHAALKQAGNSGPGNPRYRPLLQYVRFLNAIEAGHFTVGQFITVQHLIDTGIVTAASGGGNCPLRNIQTDLAAHRTAYRLQDAGRGVPGNSFTAKFKLTLAPKRPTQSAA